MPGSLGLSNSEFANPNVPQPASKLNVQSMIPGSPVERDAGAFSGLSCPAAELVDEN
jgi:hypothetical protein